jgi:membrane peptidoglycan carboxypeptidase
MGHHVSSLRLPLTLVGLTGLVGGGAGVYWFFARDLPPPTGIVAEQQPLSTKIFDRNGQLLYEVVDLEDLRAGRRTIVALDDMSPWLLKATIATEDADFYSHSGVNVRGLIRAAWSYVTGTGPVQGGSSITQQLVKNVLFRRGRTQRSIARKIREIILGVEIDADTPKNNSGTLTINYGNVSIGVPAYGIEAAAQGYFGVSARDLNLAQSSMLAGLSQRPSDYSPVLYPDAARDRQKIVLDLMVRNGDISSDQAKVALAEQLVYTSSGAESIRDIQAPHFVQYVRDRLVERYGEAMVARGGLQVTTTLDLALQHAAEELLSSHVERLKAQLAGNAALVAMRPSTAEFWSCRGVDYFNDAIDGQINMTTAERQPGSTFKIFTYVTAFQKGWTPATMLLDTRAAFPDGINKPYVPENVDGRFRGPVSVREALAMSLNIPAVRTLSFAGLDDVLAMAHRLGINTLTRRNTYGLSLTLGGGEVTLLDMVLPIASSPMVERWPGLGRATAGLSDVDPVIFFA